VAKRTRPAIPDLRESPRTNPGTGPVRASCRTVPRVRGRRGYLEIRSRSYLKKIVPARCPLTHNPGGADRIDAPASPVPRGRSTGDRWRGTLADRSRGSKRVVGEPSVPDPSGRNTSHSWPLSPSFSGRFDLKIGPFDVKIGQYDPVFERFRPRFRGSLGFVFRRHAPEGCPSRS
jgi:hypothetical protein